MSNAELLKKYVGLVQAGIQRDKVIAAMRDDGLSKIQTIMVCQEIYGLAASAAKEIVHLSSAWSDVRDRDEEFHDQLERLE